MTGRLKRNVRIVNYSETKRCGKMSTVETKVNSEAASLEGNQNKDSKNKTNPSNTMVESSNASPTTFVEKTNPGSSGVRGNRGAGRGGRSTSSINRSTASWQGMQESTYQARPEKNNLNNCRVKKMTKRLPD